MDRNKTCGVLDLKCRVHYPHTLPDLQFKVVKMCMHGAQLILNYYTVNIQHPNLIGVIVN